MEEMSTSSAHEPAAESGLLARVRAVVEPIVADLGLELYDLDFGAGMLKVTLDTPPGSEGGVSIDKISRCSRLITREFEHSDPGLGNYELECSSPGLERNLRVPRHFQREVGKTVNVRLSNVANGDRRVQGVLSAAHEAEFTVTLGDGTERTIPYAEVDRARTVFEWPAAEKPSNKPSNKPGSKTSSHKSAPKPGSKTSTAKKNADSTAESEMDSVPESEEQ